MGNKIYSFSTNDAVEHGVDAAILLHNIRYWLDYARAHDEMKQDGYYWMFMTASKMQSIMPFWSANKIQKMIKALESKGVLISGEYNKSAWNRTKWYTMPEFTHSAKRRNGASQTADSTFSQTADSLYSNKEDSNSKPLSNKSDRPAIDYEQVKDSWNEIMIKSPKISKLNQKRKRLIKKLFDDNDLTVEKFSNYLRYVSQTDSWKWAFDTTVSAKGIKYGPRPFDYFLNEDVFLRAKEEI